MDGLDGLAGDVGKNQLHQVHGIASDTFVVKSIKLLLIKSNKQLAALLTCNDANDTSLYYMCCMYKLCCVLHTVLYYMKLTLVSLAIHTNDYCRLQTTELLPDTRTIRSIFCVDKTIHSMGSGGIFSLNMKMKCRCLCFCSKCLKPPASVFFLPS